MAAQRFVVRAELRSPMLGNPVTLDALLAALIFERTGSVSAAHENIPLSCHEGLWHASSAFFEDGTPLKVTFTASLRAGHDLEPSLIATSPRTGQLPRLSEKRTREFGNVQNDVRGVAATAVWWFAEGDTEAVRELLEGLRFVGKKNAHGYGEIAILQIEQQEGTDGILGPQSMPLRPVPADLFRGNGAAVQAEAAWRPPYWRVESRTRCFVPATHLLSRTQLDSII